MTREAVRRRVSWISALMPRGVPLDDEDWAKRHATINAIAVLHIPAVFVFALVTGVGVSHAIIETLPVGVAALAGRRAAASRRVRETFTTFSLVTSSAVLVHLSGGYIELHFHFFVVVALVTLYQQWMPFLLAIAFVTLHHGVAGVVDPTSVYNHPAAINNPWGWAAIHALFISMASAVGMANWKLNELARERAEDYYRQLYEGEAAVVQRLKEADRVKSELMAAVSHEFRTPLTAILGFAQTLQLGVEFPSAKIDDFAARIEGQGRRLRHLVENLLEAERPLDADHGVSDAEQVVNDSVEVAVTANRTQESAVEVEVTPGLQISLGADAAQLVLVNLVSNAIKFASPGTPIEVRAHPTDGGAVLTVTNHGPAIAAHVRDRIFEAFVQGDSSNTRAADGVGLGLHIVHRIVSAAGGDVRVDSDDGMTTFTVRVPGTVLSQNVGTRELAVLAS